MIACPKCHRTHSAADVVALSRFAGVTGYRTADGEIHATREDAQEWLCDLRRAMPNGAHVEVVEVEGS